MSRLSLLSFLPSACGLIAGCAFAVAGTALNAQTAKIRVAECGACRWTREFVVALDGKRYSNVGEPLGMARTSRGEWLLTPMNIPAQVGVFDSAGRLLRVIGRNGAGPGEFRAIRFIKVTPGDTIHVFDPALRRKTVLAQDFSFVRTESSEVMRPYDAEFLPSGAMITAQSIPTRERAGLPIHALDRSGKVTASFGADTRNFRNDRPLRLWRSVAPVGDSLVWVTHLTRYRLELWRVNGQHIRTLDRDVPWFKPGDRMGIDYKDPKEPPKPGIMDVRADQTGLIWILIHVADKAWQQGVGTVTGMYGRKITGVASPDRYFDTVIEVFDPSSATVISSKRFDEELRFVGETPYVTSYYEDDDGFPHVRVWKLTFHHNRR